MKKYSDNYGELRKETSRIPVLPQTYINRHKAVPNEILTDENTETLWLKTTDGRLVPLGKNTTVIQKYIKIDYDTTLIPLGETLHKGDNVTVYQNGVYLAQNLVYKINDTSIKAEGDYSWKGSFEEIIISLIIIRTQATLGGTNKEDIVLPEFGEAGQVLVKTETGIAWADLDITDKQYETIVSNTLGQEYIEHDDVDDSQYNNISIATPESFPEGSIGQVLVRTTDGMGWVDVDITKEKYEDIVNNTLGKKYIVNLEGGLLYDGIDSVPIPKGIPFDGTPGQILFKTESWCEWQDVELNNVQYRRIISNTLGDNFIV